MLVADVLAKLQISIHAPRVGSDGHPDHKDDFTEISIHAPRVGSDLPSGGRRSGGSDFNPRSPCGERLVSMRILLSVSLISIHAPRVGSDCITRWIKRTQEDFNPRSPCGERQGSPCSPAGPASDFNPRSPCGERPLRGPAPWVDFPISIHAPRVGSDTGARQGGPGAGRFQSTLPVWGATTMEVRHMPEGTFQSTLPVWGATPSWPTSCSWATRFQSTLPVWGATRHRRSLLRSMKISIHAPRVGSDWGGTTTPPQGCEFQSTLPVWGAT